MNALALLITALFTFMAMSMRASTWCFLFAFIALMCGKFFGFIFFLVLAALTKRHCCCRH